MPWRLALAVAGGGWERGAGREGADGRGCAWQTPMFILSEKARFMRTNVATQVLTGYASEEVSGGAAGSWVGQGAAHGMVADGRAVYRVCVLMVSVLMMLQLKGMHIRQLLDPGFVKHTDSEWRAL